MIRSILQPGTVSELSKSRWISLLTSLLFHRLKKKYLIASYIRYRASTEFSPWCKNIVYLSSHVHGTSHLSRPSLVIWPRLPAYLPYPLWWVNSPTSSAMIDLSRIPLPCEQAVKQVLWRPEASCPYLLDFDNWSSSKPRHPCVI